MATVRPFQGILYDPQRVDLSRVVAPPYDVITPVDQRRYYQQDPHNVVRLIAGEVHPTDTPEDNKYTRAAAFFKQWMADGTLRQQSSPRTLARPAEGFMRPMRMRMVVLLPAPLGPRKPKIEPAGTRRLTSSSARKRP